MGARERWILMSKIFDNKDNLKFEQGLLDILSNAGVERADFCVGYFNLRGWSKVADYIDRLPGGNASEENAQGYPEDIHRVCRLIIGMCRPEIELIQEMYAVEHQGIDAEQATEWRKKVAINLRRQLTMGVPTATDEASLKHLRQQLADGKVCVKLHLRYPLHAKLYLAHRPKDLSNPVMSIMGSSNLTLGGMTRNGELNAEFGDYDDNQKLAKWFNARWNDRFSIDFTQDLIKVLDESWASLDGPTPYEVYLKIMYHLSREARQGVSQYHLPQQFDKELLDFQKTAVKLAVRHLEKRGGAMIGDVVGLGKTITACAVAKYYEEEAYALTLVLCPPNLCEMWEKYKIKYSLKMEVRSIAATLDQEKDWNYKLVIIDESHNLRNGEGQRYSSVKSLIDKKKNKVLLLTATPYNKDFSDLANQLKLFVDPDEPLGVRPELQIRADGGERAFGLNCGNNITLDSIRAFEKSLFADDWRDLMKLYLVRRTRTFVKNHYAKTDPKNGRKYIELPDGTRNYFPERKPESVLFRTSPGDMFERLYCEQMVDWMGDLALPRYGLQKYIDETARRTANIEAKKTLDNLSRAGKRLMGFCRSGFFKRMDSSGVSFLMSLYRHAVRNAMYLHAIKKGLDLPVHVMADDIGNGLFEDDDENGATILKISFRPSDYAQAGEKAYDELKAKSSKSVRWISPRFFKKSLANALKNDNNTILRMLEHCGEWNPADDEKLNALENLVSKTHRDDKVLVFTQYADTARYIAEQLVARGIEHVAVVDGESKDLIDQVEKFSPVSSEAKSPLPENEQTRILVATDTLSEGQNLQDAHVVVNYDLPWAIIRLIQRVGRVDRIGQKSAEVFCYSFFPQEGINEIIRLKDRLNDRINANAEAVGSDEVFFEGNKQNLTDIYEKKDGVLDEEDNGEVDLASQAFQIWESATKDNPALSEKISNMADVVYSTKPSGEYPDGVITYARTRSDADVLLWLNADGDVESQSPTKMFAALVCSAKTPKVEPLENHHELVAKALTSLNGAKKSASVGILGNVKSTKHLIFDMLAERLKNNPMPLLEQDLKAAADQVYAFPMKETAKSTLGKMLQKHLPPDDIIQTVLEFHRGNELCNVPEDGDTSPHSARIICSMGMRAGC